MKIGSIESALPVQNSNLTMGNDTKLIKTETKTPDAQEASVNDNANDNSNFSTAQSVQEKKRQELSEKMVGQNEALVIEKDPNGTGFIYKTVDKSSGEVLRVWPEATFLDNAASIQDVDTRGILMDDLV
jgi:uncharacterized FlaG/YvyC family protein